jgi:photosystem II stability/assembly factor-like uncharacterized protein/pimeloyl-ACP methyl ester carboxylesterase
MSGIGKLRGLFLVVVTCCAGGFAASSKADDSIYLHPGLMAPAGDGAALNLYCLGSGSPTVVFDAGHQDWSPAWSVVQPEIAKWTRACSYDRPGSGFSPAGPMPRTSVRIADELHDALHGAGITGPYILVGHAFGGLNMRVFAYRHMAEVAGLVLIDTDAGDVAPPDALEREHAVFAEQERDLRACRDALAAGKPLSSVPVPTLTNTTCEQRFFRGFPEKAWSPELNAQSLKTAESSVALFDAVVSELHEMPGDEAYLKQHQQSFGSRPIRVLTSADHFGDTENTPAAVHLRHLKSEAAIAEGQAQFLTLSSNAKQGFAYHSGAAYIQFDQPDIVLAAIREVYDASRASFGQWNAQPSNTTASLHGLSIVDAKVVWVSGTGGTFVRTTDGGETWQAGAVPGGEKLDFRSVYAVDARTAYLMSIGNGNESRIYKTTDAGKTWSLQYTEQNPKAFLDCMAFWSVTQGIVVGDAVDGKAELLTTSDGGAHWTPVSSESLPPAKAGEGSPASGTCIATHSEKKGKQEIWHAWFVTENASRVFHTTDAGRTWKVSEAPLVTGLNQGVFSIAVADTNRLVIVGGDYDHPQMVKPNSAYTDDGGNTWKESSHRPAGYRWCVAIVPNTPGPTAFAVGPTGMDYSIDGGKNWDQMNEVDANTIAFADAHRGWAVGQKGLILKFEGTVPGGTAPSLKK